MSAKKRTIAGAISTSLMAAAWLMTSVAVNARQQQSEQSVEAPKIVRKSGGVLQASATRKVEPSYPPLAKAAHISGAVVVEITIDESGDVIRATAISGHPLLKDAAIQAARGWKFEPTKLQGVPVKVIGTITFNFMMDSGEGLSIEAAEKAVSEHPDSGRAYYDLAMAYGRQRRSSDAIQALRDAIRVDPKFEMAYRTLGQYLDRPDTRSEAIDMLKEAIALEPRDQDAQRDLVRIYLSLKRYDEAIELVKGTLKDYPSSADPYVELARIYDEMERYDQAEEVLKQALQVEPKRVNLYAALGALYTRLGRTADAVSILKQGIAIEPGNMQAHYTLAIAYLKSGDKDSAMNEYNILKQISPGAAGVLLNEINK